MLTTEYLAANGLNFTCTVLKYDAKDAGAPVKKVMLLHGFPMFRVWWQPLLEHWDKLFVSLNQPDDSAVIKNLIKLIDSEDDTTIFTTGLHAVACDLRGYSPGASPDDMDQYDYSIFAQDTFALAQAAGFDEGFHLLGHDHGAALAWYIAANDPDSMVQSLTTLSVPHIGLMSDALCGDNADQEQVIASNYFNQFSLPSSATRNNASLTQVFQNFGFDIEPAQFQKMLWWYHGSLSKYFSMPRVVSDAEVDAFEAENGPEAAFFVKAARSAIPMEERPCTPTDDQDKVFAIEIPTLFICGVNDVALLCNKPYVSNFSPDLLPNYEHANFDCGHDFFMQGNCDSMDTSRAVMEKITAFVFGNNDKGETTSAQGSSGATATNLLKLTKGLPLALILGGAMMAYYSVLM